VNIFGNIVKKRLIDIHENQQFIAERLNVSRSAVGCLLNRDNISLDKMQAIADALDCELVIELKPKTKTSE